MTLVSPGISRTPPRRTPDTDRRPGRPLRSSRNRSSPGTHALTRRHQDIGMFMSGATPACRLPRARKDPAVRRIGSNDMAPVATMDPLPAMPRRDITGLARDAAPPVPASGGQQEVHGCSRMKRRSDPGCMTHQASLARLIYW